MGKRMSRLWRHFVTDRGTVRRMFPTSALDRIECAIAQGEKGHTGQVRFAVEAALPLQRVWKHLPPRERALEVFGLLRIWDTEANDGVLLYVLLADRDVEIVADRGIHRHVGDAAWKAISHRMERTFREGGRMEAILRGIEDISALLEQHSPHRAGARNELPDRPVVL